MKGQGTSTMGFMIVVLIIVSLGLLTLYMSFVKETIEVPVEDYLETWGSGSFAGKLEAAYNLCTMWRSPPIFFDPAALDVTLVSAINEFVPGSQCSMENPLACENHCGCLIKMKIYCNMGSRKSSKKLCLEDPCRVTLEG